MNDIEIRRAKPEDAADICRLNCEDLGYDYDREKTEAQLRLLLDRPGQHIWTAVIDGQVAGYLHACDYDTLYAQPFKNILSIAVRAAFRRRGVGQALLAAVEEWAVRDGAAGVRLVSTSTRTDAHAFYTACSYTKKKEQFNFFKIVSTATK